MSCEDHSYENQIRSNSKPTDQAFRTRAAYEEHQGVMQGASRWAYSPGQERDTTSASRPDLSVSLQHPNPKEMPGAMPYSVALQIQ